MVAAHSTHIYNHNYVCTHNSPLSLGGGALGPSWPDELTICTASG